MALNPRLLSGGSPQLPSPACLSDQLAHLQQALTDVYKNTIAVLQQGVASAQCIETEVAKFRKENHALRDWIANAGLKDKSQVEMAGTGESFASPDGGSWGNKGVCLSPLVETNRSTNSCLQESPGSPVPGMSAPQSPTLVVFPPIPGAVSAHAEGPSKETQNDPKWTTPQSMGLSLTSVIPIESSKSTPQSPASQGDSNDPNQRQHNSGAHLRPTENLTDDGDGGDGKGRLALRRRPMSASLKHSGIYPPRETTEKEKPAFRGVFMQAEELKERVRMAICKEEYTVHSLYSDTGVWQKIARSHKFEHLTLFVIAANALWMAIDTDLNDEPVLSDAHPAFQVMEHFFCAYFTVELIVRFMAFKCKKTCLKDHWFMFDSALVFMMIMDTWVMSIVFAIMYSRGTNVSKSSLSNTSVLRLVRLVRIVRMARMAKLVRLMPELMILLKGMLVATQTVFYTLCLLMLFIYVFAIAFMQLTKGTPLEQQYFSTMLTTMKNLLLNGIMPDQAAFVDELSQEHVLFAVLMLIYILIGSLTVMNMLVGVLVEVVKTVSSIEKEQMDVNFVKSHLFSCIKRLDVNHDQQISKPEFEALLETPEAAKALQNIGVDVVGLVDFMDYIFAEDQELSFPKFMETVLQLRGNNTATVRDIVDLRKFMAQELWNFETKLVARMSPQCVKGVSRVCNTVAC